MDDSSHHNEQNQGNSSQPCPEAPLLGDVRFSLVDNTKHHHHHVATQHYGRITNVSAMHYYCMVHSYS